jgi:CO/xanthine dehydrogenase Mo-binding subunit
MCQWRSGSGPSTASVSLQEDGTVSLLTGSVDITGTDTVFAQIVAEALDIDVSQVVIAKRDTDLAPFTGPSGGSRITYSQGKTVQMATEEAKEKLVALAANLLDVQPQMLICTDGGVQVTDDPNRRLSLAQLARHSVTTSGPIIGTASLSAMPFAPIFSTQAAEVKVDQETGHIRVLRFAQAQDVGVAINPMAIEGQIDGGVVQGIGRAISEEVIIKDGKILNPSLTTYLMPMAADVPSIENILVEVPAEGGPFGARAVAEPPGFGPPAAIANAIEDAVGVRLKSLPLSADKILRALRGEATEATDIDPELLQRLRR